MALIFLSDNSDVQKWRTELELLKPDIEFHLPSDSPASAKEITYAVISPDFCYDLHQFPNLKAIFSLYAGVDALLQTPQRIPDQIPLIRLISSDLSLSMSHYIILHCLSHLRRQNEYREQAREGLWQPLPLDFLRLQVGIMGLGELGQAVAEKLSNLGFDVAGWSRTKKSSSTIESYNGAAQLPSFLGRSHILVSLLPLTPATSNFIDRNLLGLLPTGACFINAGRGKLVVDDDLLACLDSGQLSAAVLDVFRTEPLPPSHPFWQHPKITITPHTASETRPCPESAQWIVDNINSIEAGGSALGGVVDLNTGY